MTYMLHTVYAMLWSIAKPCIIHQCNTLWDVFTSQQCHACISIQNVWWRWGWMGFFYLNVNSYFRMWLWLRHQFCPCHGSTAVTEVWINISIKKNLCFFYWNINSYFRMWTFPYAIIMFFLLKYQFILQNVTAITTNLYTYHNSTVIMTCVNLCNELPRTDFHIN